MYMTVNMTTIPVAAQQQSPAGRAPELCHGAARKDHGCSVWRRTGASALLRLPVHHAAAEPAYQADLHVVKTSAEAVIPLQGGDLGNLRRERRHRMHLHAAVELERRSTVRRSNYFDLTLPAADLQGETCVFHGDY